MEYVLGLKIAGAQQRVHIKMSPEEREQLYWLKGFLAGIEVPNGQAAFSELLDLALTGGYPTEVE